MKNFDELFDEFFNRKRTNPNQIENEIKRIIDALTSFKQINEDDSIGNELGEPNEVEEIIKDGLLFKKLTWNTPRGTFVKIVVSDVVSEDEKSISKNTFEKSLEEQLKDAVDAEDYELAISLRDKMKPKKKTSKKSS